MCGPAGYGKLAPSAACPGVNSLVMLQTITSSLLDYCLMGVVFARSARPHS